MYIIWRSILALSGLMGLLSAQAFAVDLSNRAEVVAFYEEVFVSTDDSQTGWVGSVVEGEPGNLAAGHLEAMAVRINGFRELAGVSGNVRLEPSLNRKAQAAALLISANHRVSHRPPETWRSYSVDGANGAANSNLTLGVFGVDALDAYMREAGSGNEDVGHRRWLLRPGMEIMGAGDIPPTREFSPANAVWVTSNASGDTSTRDGFIAWPPPGYCPKPFVYPRWSFSLPGADFSKASIHASDASGAIESSIIARTNARPMATIVWEVDPRSLHGDWDERTWRIRVSDVVVNGESVSYEYAVTGIRVAETYREAAPKIDWSKELKAQSSPVVTTEHSIALAVGSDWVALDLASGEELWSAPVSANSSAPTVASDAALYLGVKAWPGGVRALDARTGESLWVFETPGRVLAAPRWDSETGLLFFGSELRREANALQTDGSFYAVESDSGALRWRVDLGANVSGSAALDTTQVYVGTGFRRDVADMTLDGRAIAMDKRTGDLVWEFEGNGSFCVDPILGPESLVIFASSKSTVFALDRASGHEVWRFHARGAMNQGGATLGPDGDIWIGDSEGVVYRLDGLTGAKRWAFDSGAAIEAAPLVRSDGVAFVSNRQGDLFGLSDGGEALWRERLSGAGSFTPLLGPDGSLFVATEKRAEQNVYGEWIREPGSLGKFIFETEGAVDRETPNRDGNTGLPPEPDSTDRKPVLTLSRCVQGEAFDLMIQGSSNLRVQVEVSGDLTVWKASEAILDAEGRAVLSFDFRKNSPPFRFFRAKALP